MAKSMRSKVKRSFRSKKRDVGVYAATEAARLQRLNTKLLSATSKDKEEDVLLADDDGMEELPEDTRDVVEEDTSGDTMEIDNSVENKSDKISTHGPRGSRREEWRKSKGLNPRPKSDRVNRQGIVVARRKAGRSHRRR